MDEETKKECADYNRNLFLEAAELAKTADLVVFDEIMAAVNYGMVPEKDILDFLENRPKKGEPDGLEIVLTGRNPAESLLGAADYGTTVCTLHIVGINLQHRLGEHAGSLRSTEVLV